MFVIAAGILKLAQPTLFRSTLMRNHSHLWSALAVALTCAWPLTLGCDSSVEDERSSELPRSGEESPDRAANEAGDLVADPAGTDENEGQPRSDDGTSGEGDPTGSPPEGQTERDPGEAVGGDREEGDSSAEPAPNGAEEPWVGLCLGDEDLEVIKSHPEPALYKWVLIQIQGCFYGLGGSMEHLNIPEDEFQGCISDSVQENLGITVACSSCFSDMGLCSKMFCTKSCGNVEISDNMNLQGCLDCQKKHFCSHSFDNCIGWSMTQDLLL
jgi:hypothetical protein